MTTAKEVKPSKLFPDDEFFCLIVEDKRLMPYAASGQGLLMRRGAKAVHGDLVAVGVDSDATRLVQPYRDGMEHYAVLSSIYRPT